MVLSIKVWQDPNFLRRTPQGKHYLETLELCAFPQAEDAANENSKRTAAPSPHFSRNILIVCFLVDEFDE
jgi:hypothetical protein